MSYYWFNRQELLQKAKDKYHNGGGQKKAAKFYLENKDVLKEKEKIGIEACLKKKKKQKESMEEIGTKI